MAQQNLGSVLTLTTAGAGTTTSPDQSSPTYSGLVVFINISAISGTSPTLTVTLQGKDEVSGTYYTLLASAALTAPGLTVLRVYPGATNAANSFANDVVPRVWRVLATVGGTTPSVTATIGAITLDA